MAVGGRVEDAYLAEDEVRLALRGRECLVGSGRGRRGARRGETWSGPPGAFASRRALCSPSQPCAAWCLWLALQNPLKCEARTGLSCLPGYRLWDIIGAQWIFIRSMKNDGWVSEWLWEQKNHTEETLFCFDVTRRTVPSWAEESRNLAFSYFLKKKLSLILSFLKKLKLELPHNLAKPLLGVFPKEWKQNIREIAAPPCSLQCYSQ